MFKLYYSATHKGFWDSPDIHFHLTERAAKAKVNQDRGDVMGKVEFTLAGRNILFRHTAPIWREVPKARS